MSFSKFLAIALITSIGFLFLQSCTKDDVVSNSDNDDLPGYVLYNYDFSTFSMNDATVDSDISLDECQPMSPDGNLGNTDKKPPVVDRKFPFARIFQEMKLTDEQKASVRELMASHVKCEFQWFRKLQQVRDAIAKRANEERRAIMQKVKDGEITRAEAKVLIDQLNRRVREAIKNNPINEEVREGIIRCREEFINGVAKLLTDEQLVMWKRFLASTKPTK
jgi:hypothetical protein